MNGSQFWELYQSYGDVYRQEVLNEEVEELDEGRTEEIRNRMQARYGKPESRDTLRQHVAREKYVTAAANHQSGWEKSPDTGKPGKQTKGQMMYKAHRSAEAMRGSVNSSYEYDLYDVVLEHLLDEGFADTLEDAQVLMANMSEQWIDSIAEASEDYDAMSPEELHKEVTALDRRRRSGAPFSQEQQIRLANLSKRMNTARIGNIVVKKLA